MAQSRRFLAIVATLGMVVSGCYSPKPTLIYIYQQQVGARWVSVAMWGGATRDLEFQVQLDGRDGRTVIYQQRPAAKITFAEVYADEQSPVVGVLTCGDPSLRMAYNTDDFSAVQFDAVAQGMRSQIRKDYSLDGAVDEFAWACSADGSRAFVKKEASKKDEASKRQRSNGSRPSSSRRRGLALLRRGVPQIWTCARLRRGG